MSGASDVATWPVAPYWIDELGRKHEGSVYGDSDARANDPRARRASHPALRLPCLHAPDGYQGDGIGWRSSSFLLGEQLDEEDEDETVIPGGDGIVMVARRHKSLSGTYWLAVWHRLFPEAARRLVQGE